MLYIKKIKQWVLPLLVASALFFAVRPVLGQVSQPFEVTTVGSESVNGYHQVFYVTDTGKIFITEGNLNATSPATNGEYIVYRRNMSAGSDGIFLYNILTDTTIQLSSSGNSTNPKIDRNREVVWQGSVDGSWQIFLYDGSGVKQLTSGDTAVNSQIEGDNIIYARRNAAGEWRAETYSISKGKSIFITSSQSAKHPKLVKGEIYLGDKEKFALTVEDLYLLGFDELEPEVAGEATSSGELTVEDIIEELNATPSAEIIVPQIPESTESGQVAE